MATSQSLEIKEGSIFKREGKEYSEVPLSDIRIVAVILPEGLDLFLVFYSSGSTSYINPDLVDDKQAKNIYDVLTKLWDEMSKNSKKPPSEKKKLRALEAFRLFLKDYQGNTLQTSLRTLKETDNMKLLTELHASRPQRRKKIQQWLAADPEIELKTKKLKFSKQGCQVKKRLIPWDKVNKIQVEEVNFATHFYVLPEGVSGGMFSFKKGLYAINISKKDIHTYATEYFFWKGLAEENFLENK